MQDVPNVCELCLDRLRKIVHILPKSGYHKNNTGTDGADNNAHVVLLDHKYLVTFFSFAHCMLTFALPIYYPKDVWGNSHLIKNETQTIVLMVLSCLCASETVKQCQPGRLNQLDVPLRDINNLTEQICLAQV